MNLLILKESKYTKISNLSRENVLQTNFPMQMTNLYENNCKIFANFAFCKTPTVN